MDRTEIAATREEHVGTTRAIEARFLALIFINAIVDGRRAETIATIETMQMAQSIGRLFTDTAIGDARAAYRHILIQYNLVPCAEHCGSW